jgi:hypothetical protein
MPRYLIERSFHKNYNIPAPEDSEQDRMLFIENNALLNAVWVHSYVSADQKKSYCIYDAPSPEAVRQAAIRNELPVDRIIEVSSIDPL